MQALLRRCDAVLVHSAEEASIATGLASTSLEVAALPMHLQYIAAVERAARPP